VAGDPIAHWWRILYPSCIIHPTKIVHRRTRLLEGNKITFFFSSALSTSPSDLSSSYTHITPRPLNKESKPSTPPSPEETDSWTYIPPSPYLPQLTRNPNVSRQSYCLASRRRSHRVVPKRSPSPRRHPGFANTFKQAVTLRGHSEVCLSKHQGIAPWCPSIFNI